MCDGRKCQRGEEEQRSEKDFHHLPPVVRLRGRVTQNLSVAKPLQLADRVWDANTMCRVQLECDNQTVAAATDTNVCRSEPISHSFCQWPVGIRKALEVDVVFVSVVG